MIIWEMKYLAFFIFLSFVGMAVFGFAGMISGEEHGQINCVAMIVNQTACPESGGIFAFFTFHASAFKKFSTAAFVTLVLISICLMVLALSPDSVFKKPVFSAYDFISNSSFFAKTDDLLKWFSLHEASPHLIKGV